MANETIALDLDLFDNTKNGYVPAETPKKSIPKPKLLKKPVSSEETVADAKTSNRYAAKACAFALTAFIIIGSLLCFRVILSDARIKRDYAKKELEAAQSERVTLQMAYDEMLSIDKVEKYAVEKLGMVKRENYQVRYFDLSGSDGVQPLH